MNRWKKANKLADMIVKYSKGTISQDAAELAAYRYYSKRTIWDMLKPDHTNMSQIANNYVISTKLIQGKK